MIAAPADFLHALGQIGQGDVPGLRAVSSRAEKRNSVNSWNTWVMTAMTWVRKAWEVTIRPEKVRVPHTRRMTAAWRAQRRAALAQPGAPAA